MQILQEQISVPARTTASRKLGLDGVLGVANTSAVNDLQFNPPVELGIIKSTLGK